MLINVNMGSLFLANQAVPIMLKITMNLAELIIGLAFLFISAGLFWSMAANLLSRK